MRGAVAKAVETLAGLLDSRREVERRHAASKLLSFAFRAHETGELETRPHIPFPPVFGFRKASPPYREALGPDACSVVRRWSVGLQIQTSEVRILSGTPFVFPIDIREYFHL
jgi:hypothetical protein